MKPSFIIVTGLILVAVGCDVGPKSGRGFTLPDGDVDRGQTTFVQLGCMACHQVSNLDLPAPEQEPEQIVTLGGEVARIKTYGELVTSIINPTHRFAAGYPLSEVQVEGESRMRNYNEGMTVAQLIDLVAFLQSHYELREFEPTQYPPLY